MYRLKVKYRSRWKLALTTYDTLELALAGQQKLKAMGVESKICDFTGKEINV